MPLRDGACPLSLGPGVRTAGSLGFPQVVGRLLLAGLAGGLLAAAWLLVVMEPVIRSAIELEEARNTGAPGTHDEAFSRSAQVLGGVLGTVITGVVLGFVFATVYAKVRHRLPGRTDVARASLLAPSSERMGPAVEVCPSQWSSSIASRSASAALAPASDRPAAVATQAARAASGITCSKGPAGSSVVGPPHSPTRFRR